MCTRRYLLTPMICSPDGLNEPARRGANVPRTAEITITAEEMLPLLSLGCCDQRCHETRIAANVAGMCERGA